MGPTASMTCVLVRTEEKQRQRHAEGRRPCEDGCREWSNTGLGQGTPRIASSHCKLKDAGKVSSLETLEGLRYCRQLDFGPSASGTGG